MTDLVRRGRLSATDEDVTRFLSSFDSDDWIFEADIDVGRAHVVMLAEQGILDEDDAASILGALDEVEKEGFDALPEGHEDVHPAIEEAVIDRVGEDVGGRLHTARSRNDEVATCIRLRLREEILRLASSLIGLRESLVDRAEETSDWLVSGYTHLQRAQPTTVGHHLLAHAAAFERDVDRLLDVYRRVNRNPLGSAAFAGTGFGIDRHRTTELLGFDSPTRNSMDGVASRDFAVESASAASNAATNLSRLCEDIFLWSSSEFGFVELDDRYASSSSIMPQKKNPDTAELARGKTGTVHGALDSLLSITKGLPMAYNRDLQEATKHLWEAFETTRESVEVIAGAVETAEFDRDRAEESTREGFTGATELADLLVRETGMAFRTAHHIVGEVAAEYGDGDVSGEDVEEVGREITGERLGVDDEKIREALDPRKNVETRDSYGGPGEIETAVEEFRGSVDSDLDRLNKTEEDLQTSRENLSDAAEEIKNDS
ncbi:argininosuccinate lyase [Halorutilales archaeon Cl-col2-1]